MEKFYYCIIAIALSCCMVAPASAQTTAHLTGIVRDKETNEPIIGASVLLEPARIGRRTNTEGRFDLRGLKPGRYALHVRALGFDESHREIDVAGELEITIQLTRKRVEAGEILIEQESGRDAISNKLSEQELDKERGQTLGETLEHISGVTTLQTGASISKPVIRGLHSQRITVLNAGIAQEGQQWGAEHGPEIDPFSPTNIEVVKGASSVEYGAGAMGGVIRIVPRELPSSAVIRGNLSMNGFSNNMQGAVSAMVEGGLAGADGFGWRGQISTRKAGDSRTPEYVLGNTAFNELNGSVALGYAQDHYGFETFASHFGSEIGIFAGSHIGSKADLERVIAQGRPFSTYEFGYDIKAPMQSVDHDLLSIGGHVDVGSLGELEAHYGLQHNDRSEFESQRDPSKPARRSMRLKLLTHSFDLKLQHAPIGNMVGSIGINGLRQGNTGEGYDLLIPNFLTYAGGIFALEQLGIGEDLTIKFGARYDHNAMSVFALPSKDVDAQDHSYSSYSGALGMTYDLGKHWLATANLATAWRPPSINELYSNGVHHGSAQYERGDKTLGSERSINADLTLRLQTARIALEIAGYINSFDGFINLVPQPEPVLTVSGAYPSFKYEQSNARLFGGELTVNFQVLEELSTRLTASLVRGRDIERSVPIFGMPADRAELEAEYLLPDLGDAFQSSSIAVSTLAVARQSDATAADYAAPPAGYMLLNARLSTHASLLDQPIDLYLEAKNLLGQRYRDYLSRYRYFADDPGRNVILRISLPFGKH